MAYKSKFKGKEIDDRLDLVQELSDDISNIKEDIKNTIQEETDPVFSNSPAASITEEKKAEWDNKVDKVNGKQLSTEDFTTILKTKLEGLSNYDDTELSEALSTLREDFDKLVSGDTTTAIKTFNEIIAFLDGIQDSQDLSSIIASIEHQITAKQDRITDLDAIRRGAEKGATAVQPASLADYISKDNVDAKMSETSTNPVQNQAVHTALEDMAYAFGQFLNKKQDTISDLQTIREGAAKGATALQEHQPLKTINGKSIIGEGDITIEGGGGGDLSGYATEEYVNNAVESVNVKGDDGYVYSNGEKVDMRFTRSLIPVGTSIPAKANLNTVEYLKVGKYYCSQNADAKTITNCPTASAFMMEVFNPLSTVVDNEVDSTYVYRIRILTEYSTGSQYVQYCTVGSTANKWTYDSWYVCPRTKFTLNSSKNDGSAAIGAKTQGVYVDSTGTLQKMTYALNKTVPTNAVFTDTDTKVTGVANHYAPAEDESVAIEAPDGEVVIGLKRDAAGHVVGVISTPMSGGGGGGITVETDPIFSASPAASITDEKIAEWDGAADLVKGHDTDISQLFNDIGGKQDALVSGENIKTINGESIVGSGDITVAGGSGEKGDKGDKGDTGVGVQSVVQTTTSNDDDGSNVITVTLTDGTESTFTVKNGSKGDTGAYPIVESSETSVILSANKMIRITTQIVDSMEIILPDEIEGLTSECVVTFNIDESSAGAELIVPADVRWADGIIPAMTAGKAYEISFLNRCATFLEF